MKSTIVHQGGMHFAGKTESGHELHFDSKPHGEPTAGPTPMETVLQAAAACSAMDVASILQKRRKTISRFEIEVAGERSENHPKIFRTLTVIYRLWGPDLTPEEAQKAADLSQEKYCSVINMLKPVVQVSYVVEVNSKL